MKADFSITMKGVAEFSENYGVEITALPYTNHKWVIRAKNEGGNNETLVDLWELIDWMRYGPSEGRIEKGFYLPIDNDCA